MLILGLVVLISAAVTLAGLPTLRDTLMQWDLGLGDSPYFLPGHALQLYLVTPATALATSIFLLAPGLILTSVFGREKHPAAWLVSGLAIAILVHIGVTTAFQFATGITAKGVSYFWLILALDIACLVIAGLRLSMGEPHRLRLSGRGTDLWVALGLFWLCLILFAPKFYWENFTGDGSGSPAIRTALCREALALLDGPRRGRSAMRRA